MTNTKILEPKVEKKCIDCLLTKPITDFYKDKPRADGRQAWCKKCDRIRILKSDFYPEYHRKKQVRYRERYPERQKAREQAQSFYGTKHFGMCAWCGEEKPLQLHHEDYTIPLEVVPVCQSCHYQLDKYKNEDHHQN